MAASEISPCVDFPEGAEGPLAELFLAEAEFADDAAMATYADPVFAVREVTFDDRYAGGALVLHGVPGET